MLPLRTYAAGVRFGPRRATSPCSVALNEQCWASVCAAASGRKFDYHKNHILEQRLLSSFLIIAVIEHTGGQYGRRLSLEQKTGIADFILL